MAIDRTGISLDAGASDITYTGDEGPRSPQEEQQMQMASLIQEYKDYAMQQEEAGRPVMPFEEWVRSMQSPMSGGGIARLGYNDGMLVKKRADGSRPGYAFAGTGGKTSSTASGDAGEGQDGFKGEETHVPTYSEQYKDLIRSEQEDIKKEAEIKKTIKDQKEKETIRQLLKRKSADFQRKYILKDLRKKLNKSIYGDEEWYDPEEQELLEDLIARAELPLGEPGFYGQSEYMEDYPGAIEKIKQMFGPDREGQALPYYPRDLHPGTGGITDVDVAGTNYDDFIDSLKFASAP